MEPTRTQTPSKVPPTPRKSPEPQGPPNPQNPQPSPISLSIYHVVPRSLHLTLEIPLFWKQICVCLDEQPGSEATVWCFCLSAPLAKHLPCPQLNWQLDFLNWKFHLWIEFLQMETEFPKLEIYFSGLELHFLNWELQFLIWELHFLNWELHFWCWELQFFHWELHFLHWELHFLYWELHLSNWKCIFLSCSAGGKACGLPNDKRHLLPAQYRYCYILLK